MKNKNKDVVKKGIDLLNDPNLLSEEDKTRANLNMLVVTAKKVVQNYFDKEDVNENEIFDDILNLKKAVEKVDDKYFPFTPLKVTPEQLKKIIDNDKNFLDKKNSEIKQ